MSLIGQGFLIEPLVNRLKLIKAPETKRLLEKESARLQAVVEAKRKLHELHTADLVSELDYLSLHRKLNEKEEVLQKIADALHEDTHSINPEEIIKTNRRLLYAERDTIQNLLKRHKIGPDVAKELLHDIDQEINSLKASH